MLNQFVKIQEVIFSKDYPYQLALQLTFTFAYEANGQIRQAV